MKWMLPVQTSWPCHFSKEVSTYHHFQHVFLPSGRFWKVSQFAVLYQGPTKGNTHNFVDISVCFWQVFRCFRGPRCIIRLLKVLQKVFHRTQRLLQGECFSSTRLFFVRISDLLFASSVSFFFIFSHSIHITINPSSPSNHPVLYATITEMSFVEQFQALYLAPNVLRCRRRRRRRRRDCCRRFKKRLFSLMGFFMDSFLMHLLLIY